MFSIGDMSRDFADHGSVLTQKIEGNLNSMWKFVVILPDHDAATPTPFVLLDCCGWHLLLTRLQTRFRVSVKFKQNFDSSEDIVYRK